MQARETHLASASRATESAEWQASGCCRAWLRDRGHVGGGCCAPLTLPERSLSLSLCRSLTSLCLLLSSAVSMREPHTCVSSTAEVDESRCDTLGGGLGEGGCFVDPSEGGCGYSGDSSGGRCVGADAAAWLARAASAAAARGCGGGWGGGGKGGGIDIGVCTGCTATAAARRRRAAKRRGRCRARPGAATHGGRLLLRLLLLLLRLLLLRRGALALGRAEPRRGSGRCSLLPRRASPVR